MQLTVHWQNENSERKANDITITIGKQIASMCNCRYSEDYIDGGQFFCPSFRKQIIFQAVFLKTNGKTAEEIRNTTQTWVLMKPFMTVAGKSYQLDPYCSVAITDIGDTSCDAISPANLSSDSDAGSSGSESIYGIGGGILLLIVVIVAMVIILTFCIIWRQSKKAKYSMR